MRSVRTDAPFKNKTPRPHQPLNSLDPPTLQSEANVPYANTFWVVPDRLLAGEHPTEYDEAGTIARLITLLDPGIRTFTT